MYTEHQSGAVEEANVIAVGVASIQRAPGRHPPLNTEPMRCHAGSPCPPSGPDRYGRRGIVPHQVRRIVRPSVPSLAASVFQKRLAKVDTECARA